MRLAIPRIFHGNAERTSAKSSEAALDETFGPLSNVRPSLAAAEAKERERREKDGPVAAPEIEYGRPKLDTERLGIKDAADEKDAEKGKETPPAEAAPKEPPAEDGEDSGSDSESPDDDNAALDALVDKYRGNKRSMAKALRELRSLQTRTAEERKEVEARLEAAASVLDSDYDWVDGKPVLKAEAASRAMRNARSAAERGTVRVPSEAEIRAQVESEFRKTASELFDDEQMPAFLSKMRPVIDAQVNERVAVAKTAAETQRFQMLSEVGNVVTRHLAEHPEDKALLPEIDKVYGGIPEELRAAAILEEWLPFGQIAELVRLKAKLPDILKDAYALGKKHRGSPSEPTTAGTPGRSRPGPGTGRGTRSDSERAFKDAVVRGTGLPGLDSILSR